MSILGTIFKGIVAVGDILCEMEETFDGIERKINNGKSFDESTDELERKYLGGKTINERLYGK